MRFAHGRWDRQQPHVVEKVTDFETSMEWGECTCGWQGEMHNTPGAADNECEAHEREIFDLQKAGYRLVRGRVE